MKKKYTDQTKLGIAITRSHTRKSIMPRCLFGFLGLLFLSFPVHSNAGTVSVPWLAPSVSYEIRAESGVDHYQFANRIPYGATSAIDYALGTVGGPVTSSGSALPLPSSGHTVAPQVTLNSPGQHYNTARTTTGRISGDPSGTLRMEVGGDVYASLTGSHINKWEGARASAQASFTGDFTSTGTVFDYAFNGQYDRFINNSPSVGLYPPSGIHDVISEHFLTAHLTINNLSTAGTIFDGDIFSLHHMNKGADWNNISQYNQLINGSDSIDLTGTTGDSLQALLTVSIFTISQVENPLFGTTPYGGLASAGATFDYFDVEFTTDPAAVVPLPASVWLLGSGLISLAGLRKRKKGI